MKSIATFALTGLITLASGSGCVTSLLHPLELDGRNKTAHARYSTATGFSRADSRVAEASFTLKPSDGSPNIDVGAVNMAPGGAPQPTLWLNHQGFNMRQSLPELRCLDSVECSATVTAVFSSEGTKTHTSTRSAKLAPTISLDMSNFGDDRTINAGTSPVEVAVSISCTAREAFEVSVILDPEWGCAGAQAAPLSSTIPAGGRLASEPIIISNAYHTCRVGQYSKAKDVILRVSIKQNGVNVAQAEETFYVGW